MLSATAFGAIEMTRSNLHSYREQLRELAGTLGLAFEEGEVKLSPARRPGAPLFERWVRCENRLSGTVDGAAASMFDLTTIQGTGESATWREWTVISFSQSRLPSFVCVPRLWNTWPDRATLTPISFDPRDTDAITRQAIADFENAYVLGLSDAVAESAEDTVRRLFCAPRLVALAQCTGWHVQSAEGFLVFGASGILPAADRVALWREAIALRRALLAPVSAAVTSIPAAPGMDVGRQRSRRAGRRAGGYAGAFIGFFGAFIGFAVFITSRMGPGGAGLKPTDVKLFPLAFFALLPGALIVGLLAGSRLGGFVAVRRYRARDTPAPKIRKGWIVAGAILGWVVGGALGMGLTMLAPQPVQSGWLMPIVFFSPPVLGLVVGGFGGHGFARRRAARCVGK